MSISPPPSLPLYVSLPLLLSPPPPSLYLLTLSCILSSPLLTFPSIQSETSYTILSSNSTRPPITNCIYRIQVSHMQFTVCMCLLSHAINFCIMSFHRLRLIQGTVEMLLKRIYLVSIVSPSHASLMFLYTLEKLAIILLFVVWCYTPCVVSSLSIAISFTVSFTTFH